jgi:hypothetical protein
MNRLVLAAILLLAGGTAHAQVGNNNGNDNFGAGNGNGNGNGSGNTIANTATGGSNSSVVNVRQRRNTPSVFAPGLAAAGIESCLGSASVGGAGPGFGVTIGGTTTDKGCNLRLYSRTLYGLGHKVAATQILCNDPDVAVALAAEGVRCLTGPGAEAQRIAASTAYDAGEADVDPDREVRSELAAILPRGNGRPPRRMRARKAD